MKTAIFAVKTRKTLDTITGKDINNYTMNKLSERKIVSILQILQEYHKPVGSSVIALKLQELGYDLSERTIRYYLQKMDDEGFTDNLGKKGRVITERGINELKSSFVFEKVGFIASRIDTLTYQMDFSLSKLSGSIILNLTTFHNHFLYKAFEQVQEVFKRGLGMGNLMVIGYPDTTLGKIKTHSTFLWKPTQNPVLHTCSQFGSGRKN